MSQDSNLCTLEASPGSRAFQRINTPEHDKRLYECFILSSHYIFPPCLKGHRIKIGNVNYQQKAMFVGWYYSSMDFPGSSAGKESACNAGDPGLIPESRRSAGEGIGYPLQYSWASLVAQLVKNLPAVWKTWFDPWVGKIPWRRKRLPTPVF